MEITNLSLDKIRISSNNVRKDLLSGTDEVNLDNLADSIKEFGLLSPLLVIKNGDKFDVIAGQRRLLACQKINLEIIPCIVKKIYGSEGIGLSLIENIQRADMSPMDKSSAYKILLQKSNDIEKLSNYISVTTTTIKKYLALQDLSYNIKQKLDAREGSLGIETLAKLSKTFPDHMDQDIVYDHIKSFNQRTQIEMIKQTNGDISFLKEVVNDAQEGLFNITFCKRGLCNIIPEDFEQILQDELFKKRKLSWHELFYRVVNSATSATTHSIVSGIDLTKLSGN